MTGNRLLPGATETRDGAIIALSGGMDSTTLAAQAINIFGKDNVFAIGFDYGQRHKSELNHAQAVADYYGVSFDIIQLPKIFSGGKSSLMGDTDVQIMGTYTELAQKHGGQPTIVPGRNLNFLAQAATYAEIHKMNRVMIANHAGDSGSWHYFDCSPEFIAGASVAISVGTGFAVQLIAPFTQMSKGDIVRLAHVMRAPLHLTLSCYNGKSPACGECATCHERVQAFKEAGYIDPIAYVKVLDWGNLQPW